MSCERGCRYRGAACSSGTRHNGCDYCSITGKSRLKTAYALLGVKTLTEDVEELLRPENCPLFEEARADDGRQVAAPTGRGDARHDVGIVPCEDGGRPQGSPLRRDGRQVAAPTVGTGAREDGAKDGGRPQGSPLRRDADGGKSRRKKIDDERAMKLYERGLNDVEMGRLLGVDHCTVFFWRRKRGLEANLPRRIKKKNWPQILAMLEEGKTDREIGQALGVKPGSITDWRWHRGIPCNPEKKGWTARRRIRRRTAGGS